MINLLKKWLERNFSNQQAAILSFTLLALGILIFSFGSLLAPVFVAIIIAYLLDGIIDIVQKIKGISRQTSLIIVFGGFLFVSALVLLKILPEIIQQSSLFASKVPSYFNLLEAEINQQITSHSEYFGVNTISNLVSDLKSIVTEMTKRIFVQALSILPNILSVLISLILIPLLIWFLLKDKDLMIQKVKGLMPKDYSLTKKVWYDVDQQLQNYIRGKLIEILIVGTATYFWFIIFDLKFALLLAMSVGFSVLIPYVGVVVVSIPVVLVAYSQFGLTYDLAYILGVFAFLQVLDAYALVPILFSKAMDMHPSTIIVATLFFGGLWGFWGLFFAIPLAVLIKAVLLVWPRQEIL